MRRAVVRGLALWGVLLGSAGIVAALEAIASGFAYRPWTWVKVAFLYAAAAMGGEIHVAGLSADPLPIHAVPLTITAVVVVLTFRWTRSGAATAIEVAVSTAIVTTFTAVGAAAARLVFPQIDATITVSVWMTVFGAGVLVAGAGAAGAVAAGKDDAGRLRAVAAGAWAMLAWTVVVGIGAFVLLAAIRPTATAAYGRSLGRAGRTGEVLALHHLLLLPNQALLQFVPSTGGCVALDAQGGSSDHDGELCAGGEVVVSGAFAVVAEGSGVRSGNGDVVVADIGWAAWAFLLVPAAATVLGGIRSARGDPQAESRRRAALGAAAGLLFAALLWFAWWFAALRVPLPLPGAFTPVTLAPVQPGAVALAIAWGVLGGAFGGLVAPLVTRPSAPNTGDEERGGSAAE